MICNTQQYVITPKTTTKNSVWNWHPFLNSLYHFIQSKFEKSFTSLNTTETNLLYFLHRVTKIYYSTTFLERFIVFLDWSCTHSWWILIHFNIAVVRRFGNLENLESLLFSMWKQLALSSNCKESLHQKVKNLTTLISSQLELKVLADMEDLEKPISNAS